MPKPTFFNLPKKKRDHLIQAATDEFSRVPLNEASIANIVKNADIPRGSFYQYFEDKEDAFYYLLEQKMESHQDNFSTILKRNQGDLFDSFITTFINMLTEFQVEENLNFFRNAFLNMNYKMESKITNGFNKPKFDKKFESILTEVDIQKLNIKDEQEVIHVLQIIAAVTTHNLMQNFAKKYSFEEAIDNYTFEMSLLKKGLYKEDDDHK
ncbi:MAG TPA: TetR/AcrR family transcriptional regulator [Virgibacillus sp.]|nr:TetR/AcrR family transcriptional regulator [Virgibacillus sp.]